MEIQEIILCLVHDLPAIFFDEMADPLEQFVCKICVRNRLQISLIEEFLQLQQMISNEQQVSIEEIKKIESNYQIDRSASISTQPCSILDKKFDYILLASASFKQNEICSALVFNYDTTLIVAGCDHLIKVFEFSNDHLQELQQMNEHSKTIYCLQFMKQSNNFISASEDAIIIIWTQRLNKLWHRKYIFKGHKLQIFCMTLNQNDNLLISGSQDKTIKFWKKSNSAWKFSQSINCAGIVFSISLSDSQMKLISSIGNKKILIMNKKGINWSIVQKILVEQLGYRLCFVGQKQFLFQPNDSSKLSIYQFDEKIQQFKQGDSIQLHNQDTDGVCLFPIQYIQSQNQAFVKNSKCLNLIKRVSDVKFLVEQSINFGTTGVFGCVSADGIYILTWDFNSKEIQIRKLAE